MINAQMCKERISDLKRIREFYQESESVHHRQYANQVLKLELEYYKELARSEQRERKEILPTSAEACLLES